MTIFICTNCGYGSASWYGKCPNCNQWHTLIENSSFEKNSTVKKESLKKVKIVSLDKITTKTLSRTKTGVYEFDRVVGGGLTEGETILLSGEPGIGKSTLVLQILQNLPCLYISGEEAAEQVKNRALRLGVNLKNFLFSSDLQVEGIIEVAKEIKEKIKVLVIDSIQTVYSKDVEGITGGISQIKETTKKLVEFAKKNLLTTIIIGHITKEGDIAGPKTLEHYVDCVLNFEGEKLSDYRLLRTTKNRFGTTDEIGVFQMTEQGLKEINNPLVFINQNKDNPPGKAIVGINEGKRPLFFEIQTLVVPTVLAVPRRVVKGMDYNKVLLLLAVAKKYLFLSLDKFDVYVNVVGGVSIKSPTADLGLIASLYSSIKNFSLPVDSFFIGEVGLLGEVRPVFFEQKIISEGKRLGFKKSFSSVNLSNINQIKNYLVK
ncbi:MAG: DNA repair protein RadA [Patescibacteria group bacterium]|nr:DNA repair protein RadA [Patescibacteria group bacterium]